jgi:hypothetical protein
VHPPLCHRRVQLPYNVNPDKRCHKIENISDELKDWLPIAIRYEINMIFPLEAICNAKRSECVYIKSGFKI